MKRGRASWLLVLGVNALMRMVSAAPAERSFEPDARLQEYLQELLRSGTPQSEIERCKHESSSRRGFMRCIARPQDYTEPPPPPASPAEEATSAGRLQAKADAGDARAQYELGQRFFHGRGVRQDPVLGLRWLTAAAAQDVREAEYELGRRFLRGDQVDTDVGKAIFWLHFATNHGHPAAGRLLDFARGVNSQAKGYASINEEERAKARELDIAVMRATQERARCALACQASCPACGPGFCESRCP